MPDVDCSCVDETSEHPVRFSNGELKFEVTDLSLSVNGSSALGGEQTWGHTRTYGNRMPIQDYGNGFNWPIRQWGYLIQQPGGTLVVVMGANRQYWFDPDGMGGYTGRDGSKYKLSYIDGPTEKLYRLLKPTGERIEFQAFTPSNAQPGRFQRQVTSGGLKTEATYNSFGQLTQVDRLNSSGTTAIDSFIYSYVGSGVNTGRLETITWTRSSTNLQRVRYTYYDGTTNPSNGSLGDLQTAVVEEYDGSSWQTLHRSYYRYYVSSGSGGFVHGLKYVVGPEAYERMIAHTPTSIDPITATDTELNGFADYRFTYDSNQRVSVETVDGGAETYNFSYTANSNVGYTDDYNNWKIKTVEDRPDGSQRIVYTNYVGQVMLRDLRESTGSGAPRWIEYRRYFSPITNPTADTIWYGLLDLHAEPSAIKMSGTPYDDTQNNLNVALKTGSESPDTPCVIHRFEYYPTVTSPTAVQNGGWTKTVNLQHGTGGIFAPQKLYGYDTYTGVDDDLTAVSAETIYRDESASDAITTTFAYDTDTGGFIIKTMTLPRIPTGQNGPPSTSPDVTIKEAYEAATSGTAALLLRWRMDERGTITYWEYDSATGAVTKRIDDVNTSTVGVTPIPTGFTNTTGQNLVTDFEVDTYGRTTQELGPAHNIAGDSTVRRATWTIHDDINHQVRVGRGYCSTASGTAYTLINPVSIQKYDHEDRVVESIQAARGSSLTSSGKLVASDTFAQSSYSRWTVNAYSDQSRLTSTKVYNKINPTSGSPLFDETLYGYDSMGRQNRVLSPGGTITATVYDVRNLVTQISIGTDDTVSTSNMRIVRTHQYDGGSAGGDGLLTEVRLLVDSGTPTSDRVTDYTYDWRRRQTSISGPENFYQYTPSTYYDNLNQLTQVDQKNGSSGNLIARSLTAFDNLGRVYRQTRYAVNSSGTPGNSLVDNTWYDAAGNVLQSKPAGSDAWTKTVYDNLGRSTTQYVGYGSAAPDTVTGDVILEQTVNTFDAASNLTKVRLRRRFDNAAASQTGALADSTSSPASRSSYLLYWYDALGRQTDVANYGTNGGNGDSDPSHGGSAPSRSDTVLVATTAYNLRGEGFQTYDPTGSAGRLTELTFDDAGRLVTQIDNVVASGTDLDQNRTTNFTYTADGLLATLIAISPTGTGGTGDQTTQYCYGTTLSDSEIASSQFLRGVIYPDSTNTWNPSTHTFSGTYNRVEYKYNRQGQVTELMDQNQTVHAYGFDDRGRLLSDTATLHSGSGIDNAILQIARTYEPRGMLKTVTSYDGSSTAKNQVQFDYNDFGQLGTEWQEHSGAVNTSTSLNVQYGYEDSSGSTNTVHRKQVTYPNGRQINFVYTSGIDASLSRVSQIKDGSTDVQATYAYLGLGTVAIMDLPTPHLRYTLAGSSRYSALDTFDRIPAFIWFKYDTSAFPERLDYTFDRLGNRLSKQRQVLGTTGNDEKYAYDGLYRLRSLDRGTLSGGSITSPTFKQNWDNPTTSAPGLDPTGNWTNFRQWDNGTTLALNQSRSHDKANTLTSFPTTGTGTPWSTPGHDNAGNMTVVPRPNDLGNSYSCTYDAWNRLVDVTGATTTTNEYDGLHRRIRRITSSPVTSRHYYYSDTWQVLEERYGSGGGTINRQFIWGLRYIDDLIRRDRSTTGTLDEKLFVMQDGNFNVTVITDDTGTVKERYRYDAYGVPTFLSDTFTVKTGGSDYDWETLYAGYRYDSTTGLYHVRYRAYHPSLGRWMQRDPASYRGVFNLYQYVGNSPLRFTDAIGLEPDDPLNALGVDERTRSMMRTWRGRAQLALETLCNCTCLECSKPECMEEVKNITDAYVDMFLSNRTWQFPRFGLTNDLRHGLMCYQWQALTYNALDQIVKKGKCFRIARVGTVEVSGGKKELTHNWVAITAFQNRCNPPLWFSVPASDCTVYLDPWIGEGPGAYCHTGVGYEDGHPPHNFEGTNPSGSDPTHPTGMGGLYKPPTGDPLPAAFEGWEW